MQYKIFQLTNIRTTDYSFMSWDFAKDHGFNPADYYEVYYGEMEQEYILDNLWVKFNIDHPADFRGHSLSVSDVIGLKKPENDYWYYYYCDSLGWKEITGKFEEV